MRYGQVLRRRGGGGMAGYFRAAKCWLALSLPSLDRAFVLPCTLMERVAPAAPARFRLPPFQNGGKLSAPALGLRAILNLPPLSPLKKHPVRSRGRFSRGTWLPPYQGTSGKCPTAGRCDREIALVRAM